MNRFAHVLKHAEDRLRAPEPARTRILLEMAADLEDGYRHYLERGLDEADAARRAEEAFSTSDETLRLLERVHQRSYGGSSTTRFFHRVGTVWSTALLVPPYEGSRGVAMSRSRRSGYALVTGTRYLGPERLKRAAEPAERAPRRRSA